MGEMIERLDFSGKEKYSAVEATIHLNRYAMARPYVAGKRVLDVASGEGYGSFLLRRWGAESVEGIDVDEQTVETATRLFGGDGVHYQCHTAEQLPFEDHTFDVVCSFETSISITPNCSFRRSGVYSSPAETSSFPARMTPIIISRANRATRSTRNSTPISISSSWLKNISASECATIWRMP